jgi:membrane fusion protein (multidrug efflux system)
MKPKVILPIALVVVLVAAAIYKIVGDRPSAEMRRQNIIAVTVQQPQRETIIQRIQLTGDVLPIQQASIFSKVSGTLDRVYANIGTKARTGQLLALIDTTELVQQVEQMAATYYNARATFLRTKQLLEQNLVSKQDLDNAEALMLVAQANLDGAKTRLGYARITAPFSGTITKRFMDPGAVVSTPTNATLFSLMDYDTVKVVVNVLEKDLPLVHRGTPAIITVDAYPGKENKGVVTRLAQAIDLSTRTMAAEIDIPNSSLLLRPGMYANVVLVVAERANQVTVPTQALLKDDNGSFVYAVQGKTARRVNVSLGVEQGGQTEILNGLQGDERVIVMGQQLVKDGGEVRVE